VTDNTQGIRDGNSRRSYLSIHGRQFSQNNPFMLPVMVDHVVAAATTVSGNIIVDQDSLVFRRQHRSMFVWELK
jgi:tRNA/tmRNA/rRNA uracil-C5-methylase (TrmA/RlmC/RlmD family)